MANTAFAQQLIDDFDMDQLGLDIAPYVKQETGQRDFATCSMAAQPCARNSQPQPAGSVDNCTSIFSCPHSPPPEIVLPLSANTDTMREELSNIKWPEKASLKNMNFLEMCAAEILCPEAGVLGKPFADKVLTECVKSVSNCEDMHMTSVPSPETLCPLSNSSRGSTFESKTEDSYSDFASENSSDTVFFQDCKGPVPPACGLDTPPDTPPDTPAPPQVAATRACKRSRLRGVCPSAPIEISDEELINLPVRELNKRLQGFPKDQVSHLKQKRRTLKNRGYAQNCRSKRMVQKQVLESTNKNLYDEIDKLKKQLLQASKERDVYKHRYQMLQAGVANAMKDNGGSQLCKLPSFRLLTEAVSSHN